MATTPPSLSAHRACHASLARVYRNSHCTACPVLHSAKKTGRFRSTQEMKIAPTHVGVLQPGAAVHFCKHCGPFVTAQEG